MSKQPSRLWSVLALLLSLALLAGACGSDDESSSSGDSTSTSDADASELEAELEAARAELEAAQADADTSAEEIAAAEAALAEAEAAAEAGAPADLPYGLTPGKPYAGTEVTFLICCEGAAQFQVWRASRPEFERLTGITVNFTDDPLGGLREKIVTESVASPGSWDATIMFDTWLPDLANFLAPLSDEDLADIGIDDYPTATADLGVWEGTQYGVPARSHVMMFYYREDVLADLGIAVPTTFAELLAAAEAIDAADNGMNGFTLNWAKQASISPIPWQQMLKAGGAEVFDADGNVVFDSAEAIAATQVYQDLLEHAPSGAAAYNEGDMRTSFASGEAAMTIAWSWSMEVFQNPAAADESVLGNVGFTSEIPGVAGTTGPLAMAWPIAISADSENAEAAAEWVKWMTNPDLDRQGIAEKSINGQATVVANRISSLESPEANAPEANNGFSQAMADAYTSATHQPIYAEFATATEIIETAMSEIVAGADVAATLEQAAADVAEVRGG